MKLFIPSRQLEASPHVRMRRSVQMQFDRDELSALDLLGGIGGRHFLLEADPWQARLLRSVVTEVSDTQAHVTPNEQPPRSMRTSVSMPGVVLLHGLVERGRLLKEAQEGRLLRQLDPTGDILPATPQAMVLRGLGVAAMYETYLNARQAQANFDRFNADPLDPDVRYIAGMQQNAQAMQKILDTYES